jgi:hypothetical protein
MSAQRVVVVDDGVAYQRRSEEPDSPEQVRDFCVGLAACFPQVARPVRVCACR